MFQIWKLDGFSTPLLRFLTHELWSKHLTQYLSAVIQVLRLGVLYLAYLGSLRVASWYLLAFVTAAVVVYSKQRRIGVSPGSRMPVSAAPPSRQRPAPLPQPVPPAPSVSSAAEGATLSASIFSGQASRAGDHEPRTQPRTRPRASALPEID